MDPSWLPQWKPETFRLVAVAIGASIATATSLELYRSVENRKRRLELGKRALKDVYGGEPTTPTSQEMASNASTFGSINSSLLDSLTSTTTTPPSRMPTRGFAYDESLIREQLSRNYSFFGEEGMGKVRKGRVVVVGCGGVGSWAAIMLVRSGVSSVRLIDFDMVTLSSLNRHAVATLSDVGTPKVVALKKFFERIAPWCDVDVRQELWQAGTQGERLLAGDVDWVIDAIDNIGTKIELLKYCHKKGIKVFASMGAGAKSDPTRVQISDISNTVEDRLARSVRRGLRVDGIVEGIPVVYSTEVSGDVKLLPLTEDEVQKGGVHELAAFDNFRVRILPVIGPLPSIFGLHIATYILCDLAGKPILNPLAIRHRKKLYEKLHRDLTSREAKLYSSSGLSERLTIDEADVGYIFEDLNRGRSSLPPHPILQRPMLSRWDGSKPLSVDNCVILSPDDIARLDNAGGKGVDVLEWSNGVSGAEASEAIEKRLEEARRWAEAIKT